jgi:hypothetical protein
MAQVRTLNEQLGLSIHGNPVTLPPGTALVAQNLKCVRDNVYTKVRGRKAYGSGLPSQNIVQLFQYQDRLFCHMGNNTIYYDSDGAGTFTQKTGTFLAPDTNYKIKSLELAGNNYIATSTGLMKLDSLTGTYVSAGAPKGLSFDLRIINSINWMSTGNTVAYRHVWSIEDANNNMIDGAPSERQEITNSSGSDRAVELRITIPNDVTTSYYLKIYRASQNTGTPAEDFQLVYQAHPTSTEISAGIMTINDILADDWRGAYLYTNTTQEGIAQANERPPLSNVITTFKNYTFYGNIQNLNRLYTALISVTGLTSATSTIKFDNGTSSITLGCYILRQACGTAITNCADNGAGLIRVTTSANHGLITGDYVNIFGVTGTTEANANWQITQIGAQTFDLDSSAFVHAYTAGGTVDIVSFNALGNHINTCANNGVGLVRVTTHSNHGLTTGDYVRIMDIVGTTEANGTWAVTVIDGTHFDLVGSTYANAYTSGGTISLYEDYGTTPRFILYNRGTDAQNIANTAKSIVRCLNLCTSNTYWNGYYTSSSTDPVGKMEFTTQSLGSAAFYLIANSTTTGGCFSPTMPVSGTTYVSTNDDFQHAVMWSKENQAEAVPLVNIKKIGSADDPIVGIVGLRDSLFVIKQKDGIWRLTGESESSFNWDEFDGTTACIQKNSIVKGEDAIYMMSSSGYVKISDVGVEVIGRDNEKNDLKPVKVSGYENAGYGWFYDSEKAYKVATYIDQNSTSNDIMKEFNVFTNAWTESKFGIYTNDTNISAGIVIADYEFTSPLTGNGLLKERKDLDTTDYTLPDIANTITAIDINTKQITLGTNITIHDDALITQGALTKVVTKADTTAVLTLSSITNLAVNMTANISNCANNGAGLIRVTTATPHGLATENGVTIASVTGTTEANGNWVITVIGINSFDLIGSTFAHAYAAGGTVTNAITIKSGIYSRLKYQMIHGGYPEYEKFFEKATILFDNDETSISKLYIRTTTDADYTAVTTTVDETSESLWEGVWSGKWGDRDIKDKALMLIPSEHSRGSHIYLDIIHSMPQQRIDLTGYSLIYNIVDTRYMK